MSVYNSEIVIIVFLADKTSRILTEGSHLILERLRIADKFGLVKHIVHVFHDLISDLYAHADIHRSRRMSYVIFCTDFFQPLRSPAACGHYSMICKYLCPFTAGAAVRSACRCLRFYHYASAYSIVENHVAAVIPEENLNAIFLQEPFYGKVYFLSFFRAQVAYRTVHQFKPRLNGPLSYILDFIRLADAFHLGVRTEFQINLIRIIYYLLSVLFSYKVWQVSPHLAA